MEPITLGIMAAMGLISGGTQLVQGISDRRKGKKLEEAAGDRPEYEVPESVDRMIEMYRQMSTSGLPGQSLAEDAIQGSTARTIGQAGQLADSPVAALTALGGAQQRELGALRDLQMRASQYRDQAQRQYIGAVGQRSQYEDESWRQNQLLPWEIDMNRAAQLQTAGSANIMGGVDAMAGGVSSAASAKASYDMYDSMKPNYTNANPVPDTASYNAMFSNSLGTSKFNYNPYG